MSSRCPPLLFRERHLGGDSGAPLNSLPHLRNHDANVRFRETTSLRARIPDSDGMGRKPTLAFCGHIVALVEFGVCLSVLDRCGGKFSFDADFEAFLYLPLCQICRIMTGKTRTSVGNKSNAAETGFQTGVRFTFGLDGVLVEDIDQLIFTTGFAIFGVVGSIVLQKGVVDSLFILKRQRFNMRQEFIGYLELMGAHPVGAQL